MSEIANIEIEIYGLEIEVEVTYNYTPYLPAYTGGLPEDCYPAEGGEMEVISVIRPANKAKLEDKIDLTDLLTLPGIAEEVADRIMDRIMSSQDY